MIIEAKIKNTTKKVKVNIKNDGTITDYFNQSITYDKSDLIIPELFCLNPN